MKKHLLTTGEFAKLCRTAKGTLLFYDKEGLLKPKHVSENGYRRYEIEQYFEFELLSMLKEVGSSLKEIKTHVRCMDGEDFLSFLEEKQIAAVRELNRMRHRTLMLGDMAECLREALHFEYDVLSVKQQEEERLEVTPTGAAPSESKWELVQRFVEYIDAAGMVIKSDIYVYDMMIYVTQEIGDSYALKYSVLVE